MGQQIYLVTHHSRAVLHSIQKPMSLIRTTHCRFHSQTRVNLTHNKTNHHNSIVIILAILLQSVIPSQSQCNRLTWRPGNIEQGQGAPKSHYSRPLKGCTPHNHRVTCHTSPTTESRGRQIYHITHHSTAALHSIHKPTPLIGQPGANSSPKPNLMSVEIRANSTHTQRQSITILTIPLQSVIPSQSMRNRLT